MQRTDSLEPTARSNVYRFLGLAFASPGAGPLDRLEEQLSVLEASLEVLGDGSSLDAARALGGQLRTTTPKMLEAGHVRCFGYTISKECPPYETEYGQAHIFQKAQRLADIAGFYRAFGLEIAPDFRDRLDHVSVELEFMHFLCVKEAYALAKGHPAERSQSCRAAQRKFFEAHLGSWGRRFARALEAKAQAGLHADLGRLLAAFLERECETLEVTPEDAGPALQAATGEEQAADCQTCRQGCSADASQQGPGP